MKSLHSWKVLNNVTQNITKQYSLQLTKTKNSQSQFTNDEIMCLVYELFFTTEVTTHTKKTMLVNLKEAKP
jgi:hypothetical protein